MPLDLDLSPALWALACSLAATVLLRLLDTLADRRLRQRTKAQIERALDEIGPDDDRQ